MYSYPLTPRFLRNLTLTIIASLLPCVGRGYCEPRSHRIGLVLPLTGGASFWGTNSKNGALLAVEDLRRRGIDVSLIVEDSRCDPKTAVSAIQKLISTDKVEAVVGEICSSGTLAMAAVAERQRIPLITPCSASPNISKAGSYIFRTWSPSTVETDRLAEFTAKKLGAKRIAVLYVENDFGSFIASDIATRLSELGATVVLSLSHPGEETDFRSRLLKVKSLHPDALVIGTHLTDALAIVKQSKELKLDLPILGVESLNSVSGFLEPLGPLAEGVYLVDYRDTTTEEYKSRYTKTYGGTWPGQSSCAALAYDAVLLAANAAKASNGAPEAARAWLENVRDFPGASGSLTFDNNGDIMREPAMYRIEGGRYVELAWPEKDR